MPIVALLLALTLGACRSSAPLPPPPTPAPPSAPGAPVDPGAPGLIAFEQRHRAAAQAARNEGRLADARQHWDVILALRPDDADAKRERKDVHEAMQALAADRYAKARATQQRGETDQAQRQYLEVLQIAPTHPGAADALRAMEVERTRRGHVQALSAMRSTEARSLRNGTPIATSAKSATVTPPRADSPEARIEAEHATLAVQDDKPGTATNPTPSPAQPDACRRAQRLDPTDRNAAVRAWRQCLEAAPDHPGAAAQVKALEGGVK